MTGDELSILLDGVTVPAPRRRRTAPDGPPRPIGYIRVSRDEEGRSGLGMDAQRDAIAAEVERRGWTVGRWVEDICSGATPPADRPGLRAALDDLRRGAADVLMVARVDRLSRSLHDFTGLLDRSIREGWAVVALDAPVDTSTPAGKAMIRLLGTFAELERDLISARTREAIRQKQARGIRHGAERTTPDDVTRRIVEERRAGRTYEAIAAGLNADGVPTVKGGREWWPATVWKVMLSVKREAALAAARDAHDA